MKMPVLKSVLPIKRKSVLTSLVDWALGIKRVSVGDRVDAGPEKNNEAGKVLSVGSNGIKVQLDSGEIRTFWLQDLKRQGT